MIFQVAYICGIFGFSPSLIPYTTKAYMGLMGTEIAHTYLQGIYCKVKLWIQRESSHTIKSRCACVWNMYMMYGG